MAARENVITHQRQNNRPGNIAPYGWSSQRGLAGGFEVHTNEETEQHNQPKYFKTSSHLPIIVCITFLFLEASPKFANFGVCAVGKGIGFSGRRMFLCEHGLRKQRCDRYSMVPPVSSAGNGRSYRTLSLESLRCHDLARTAAYDRRLYQYHESIVCVGIPWHRRVGREERSRMVNRERNERAGYVYGVMIAMEAVVESDCPEGCRHAGWFLFLAGERWRSRR